MREFKVLFAALSLTALAGCAETPAPVPAPPPHTLAVQVPTPPAPPVTKNEKFQNFLRDFKATALAKGVTSKTYDRAVAGIAPIAGIGTIVAEQPEFVRPVWDYLDSAVSDRRIADAKALLARNASMLDALQKRYGVPKEILVAIWGMETNYGRNQGRYNLFAALATEAYEGQRQAFGRRELIAALLMLQQHDYEPSEMVSSWAGAFGQTQFLPTTFFEYATDGDNDGKIDLWHSPADALASAARLFQRQGWQTGKPWGYEVALPKKFPYQDAGLRTLKPLSDWAALGVRRKSGAPLPKSNDMAALYLPAGARGPALLTLHNFRQIMRYNNATSYALAVSLLSDRMMGRPGLQASWPRDEKPLSLADRLRFQVDLAALGYKIGPLDGVLGRKTRLALRKYQLAHGLPADGYPSSDMLSRLDADTGNGPMPAATD